MSITLFYGGFACVVLGAVGLLTLLILFLRGRARRDRRDQLMAEIELAESRTQELSPPKQPAPGARPTGGPASQGPWPRRRSAPAGLPLHRGIHPASQEDTPKPPVRQSAPVSRPAPPGGGSPPAPGAGRPGVPV